jgi:hypothetical protein
MGNLTRWRWVEVALWIGSLCAGLRFIDVWTRPDLCLDLGWSFDYQTWTCSRYVASAYRYVPAYMFPSLWLFVVGIVAAISTHVSRRYHAT